MWGILISPGRTASQLLRIRELFTANLLANEQLGREATGVALLNNDSSLLINKAPLTASRYIHSTGYLDVMRSLFVKTTVLLGSYTLFYLNPALPYALFLLKYKNPVSVHWDKNIGPLFFSSRYLFFRKTFGHAAVTDGLP